MAVEILVQLGLVLGAFLLAILIVVKFSATEKNPVIAGILAVISPFLGFVYARPPAWGFSFFLSLVYFAPATAVVWALYFHEMFIVGGVLGGYLVLSAVVTAVLMTHDHNAKVRQKSKG